jgi:hypothetical protein
VSEDLKKLLCAELRRFEGKLTEAALAETLRLLESPHCAKITEQHARQVAEYDSIEIAASASTSTPECRRGATLGLACWPGSTRARRPAAAARLGRRREADQGANE